MEGEWRGNDSGASDVEDPSVKIWALVASVDSFRRDVATTGAGGGFVGEKEDGIVEGAPPGLALPVPPSAMQCAAGETSGAANASMATSFE